MVVLERSGDTQAYPHVPTPKELELSRQLVELQQDKDQREQKLFDQVKDLESQVHKCVVVSQHESQRHKKEARLLRLLQRLTDAAALCACVSVE